MTANPDTTAEGTVHVDLQVGGPAPDGGMDAARREGMPFGEYDPVVTECTEGEHGATSRSRYRTGDPMMKRSLLRVLLPLVLCSACAHARRPIGTVPEAVRTPSAASPNSAGTQDERLELVRDPKVPKRWLVVGAVSRRLIAFSDTIPNEREFL